MKSDDVRPASIWGWVVAIVLAAVLFAIYVSTRDVAERYQVSDYKTRRDNRYCGTENWTGGGKPPTNGAANWGDTAEQRQYELCQQWRSANATEEQAFVSLLQFGLGIAGAAGLAATVYYAFRAARAAENQVKESRRSVDALVRAEGAQLFCHAGLAELAQEVRDIARDVTYGRVSCAYPIMLPHVALIMTNYGRSPATLRDIGCNIAIGNLPKVPSYQKVKWPEKTILPPGESTPTNYSAPESVSNRTFVNLRHGHTPMHVVVRILYADVFGDDHELRIIWRFDPNKVEFVRVHDDSAYNMNT